MSPASVHGAERGRVLAAAAAIAAMAIAIYWRALGVGFLGDDFMILHRVRIVESAGAVLRFFRGEFFEYYRPLGFVLHTIDWWLGGAEARQFHFTNLLLHATAAVLVLLIGRSLSPRSIAGPLAALLFALHASNHEAVVWISARFDLLATVLSLAAILALTQEHRVARAMAPAFFFLALLSKESAVALPIAAAGYWVFVRRARMAATLRHLAPWLAALVLYSALRSLAGGISAVGGAGRLPKLMAFVIVLAGVVLLAGDRSTRFTAWMRERRWVVPASLIAIVALGVTAVSIGGRAGAFAADKLAVAGFALFNLTSPVTDVFERPFYLYPHTTGYWLGGAIAVMLVAIVIHRLWRRLVTDDRVWFLLTLLVATLLPVSALTEGTRYLYLPSAAVALLAAVLIAEYAGRWRPAVLALTAVYLAVSAVQISMKLGDWVWAGTMTREGAQLVEAARPPGCGGEHVVFLTSPVAVRGVYTHFYYETFELPRGCMPDVFQVVARVVRLDSVVEATWDGPSRIVLTVPAYRDNFVLSEDLRHFNREVRDVARTMRVMTPLGEVRAEPSGDAERFTLSLAPDVRPERIQFFYYSNGRIRPLPPAN